MSRRKTNGQKSLNDFCRAFYGGQSGPPQVVPYKFEDVVATLNRVSPYDWSHFLRERLDSKSPHAPLGGIENGGWRLMYTSPKKMTVETAKKTSHRPDLSFSLRILVPQNVATPHPLPHSPPY